MHTITLDNGTEQLKEVLETFSNNLDNPISVTRIDEILTAIQQLDDGEEEDIEMNVSLDGEPCELLIKSSTVHFTGPKISLSTISNTLANILKKSIK